MRLSAWSRLEFLPSGDGYYESVLAEIGRATRSVLVENYIFRFDETGRRMLQALASARIRGVRVYLRLDGVGCRENLPALVEFCARHELELEVYHPLPLARFRRYGGIALAILSRLDFLPRRWQILNRRLHRKLVLVDETIAYAGGRNVDDAESETRAGVDAWHDLSVRLEGEPVRLLVLAFWLWPFRRQPSHDFLLNYTLRLKLSRNTWFFRRLQIARERFWVVSPYFAPTPAMLFQLRMAARRGVDVRIVLPAKNDVPVSRLAARALYRRLLGWGIRIYEYQPRILHRKLWVIDDVCVAGSGNLNHRSFLHDLEIDMILRRPDHVARGRELILEDLSQSREIRLDEMDHLPVMKRTLYWLASWLVYWL